MLAQGEGQNNTETKHYQIFTDSILQCQDRHIDFSRYWVLVLMVSNRSINLAVLKSISL